MKDAKEIRANAEAYAKRKKRTKKGDAREHLPEM